jgi:hypothetical protein
MAACGAQQALLVHLALVRQVRRMAGPIGMCSIPAVADTTFILEANVVTDKQVVLTAKRVWYYSENDEAAFFEWLDKLPCVEKYEGELDVLEIHINQARLDAGSLYELLALFRRYNIDMTQLRVFDRDEFASWFRNPKSYWFKEVFE